MATPAKDLQVSEITRLASNVFEDEGYAMAWLNEPNIATGDQSPIELLSTTPNGFEIVKNVLLRIQYGVLA
jgi:putative toxin-antitoxin system antitoxin component (TIGR02293 family)